MDGLASPVPGGAVLVASLGASQGMAVAFLLGAVKAAGAGEVGDH
jgi:hypothetical protein